MSLRSRLLAGMVVLVTAGLAVTAVVTFAEQRSFLYDRVDAQTQAALGPLTLTLRVKGTAPFGRLHRSRPQPLSGRAPPGPRRGAVRNVLDLPPGTFGEIIGPGGDVLGRRTFSYGQASPRPPALPAHFPVSSRGARPQVFEVGGSHGVRYRAVAVRDGRAIAVAAVPRREAAAPRHRLVMVEHIVGGAVILAILVLGRLVILIGLRPLQRIGRVAAEIAHGDLSRRVAPDDERTEVGRLGRSLNEMLAQIESAFADRARSEARLRSFIADASHELRTPLAAIRGYAEVFRLGAASDPETLGRAMARIESEATRMGVLVEDLLLLAELDQGARPRREPVDLGELAREAAFDARAASGEPRTITVHTSESDGPLVVAGDPDRLRQVLGNLVRNAVIHTPAGTAVEISVHRSGDRVDLSVRDHGRGLPPGDPEKLFERFWRSESGRRRGPGGAGLGLAIVRAIVDAHDGSVTAAAAPGAGARFTVSLPATPGTRLGHPSLSPRANSQQTLS